MNARLVHWQPNLLRRPAFFGDDVLIQCTVSGERDYPGLPVEELMQLKHAVYMQFPQYWNSPQEFEPLWTKCKAAIGQACKRLRSNNNSVTTNTSAICGSHNSRSSKYYNSRPDPGRHRLQHRATYSGGSICESGLLVHDSHRQ